MKQTLKQSLNRLSDYSDHALLNEVRRVSELLGRTDFTIQEFEANARCSYAVLKKRFGGLATAISKVGLESRRFNRNIPDQELPDELERIWLLVLENEGRRPYRDDLKKYESKYSPGPYYDRWGTCIRACEAVLNRPEDQVVSTTEDIGPKSTNATKEKYVKRSIPLKLRWQVFQRDNFACKACGRSPATHPGVKLHCDHILAEVDGGKSILANLQTLCDSCNVGKGRDHGK